MKNIFNDKLFQIQFSKYPFKDTATLSLQNIIFPAQYITGLQICYNKPIVNLYISSIQLLDQYHIKVQIKDQNNIQTFSFVISNTSTWSSIRDSNNIYRGSVGYNNIFYIFKNILTKYFQIIFTFTKDIFPILQSCIVIKYTNKIKKIKFQDTQIESLNLHNGFFVSGQNTAMSINARNDLQLQQTVPTTIDKRGQFKYINNIPINGRPVVIKHTTLSDLRVITEDNSIKLKGVTDI